MTLGPIEIMELILERIAKRKTYTIGRLYIRRQVMDEYLSGTADDYFCDTLEPTWRDYEHGAYKVKGRSAIPEGRYAVVISFSPKFKQWLPILLGVPKFGHPHPCGQHVGRHRRLHTRWQEPRSRQSARQPHLGSSPETEDRRGQG